MVLYDNGLKQRKYNVNQGYKINPQHFGTRVLLCQQVLRLDLRLSYGIGFALIAYTLLYYYLLIFFMNILHCYFPEPLVNTVEIRFTFSQQYKPVYDNLEADETKNLTNQIVNAVSHTFVHNFIS